MANNTIYPFGLGGQMPSSIGIVNDLTTGGADKALSAEQGAELAGDVYSQIQKTLDLTSLTVRSYSLGTSKWILSNGNGKHIAVPVTAGKQYLITPTVNGNFYGFVTSSYTVPSSDSDIPYANGGVRNRIDSAIAVTAPSAAAYLILCVQDGAGHNTTWSAIEDYPTTTKVSVLEEEVANMAAEQVKPLAVDLSDYTAVRAFPNPTTWVVTDDDYPYYGIFIKIPSNVKKISVETTSEGATYYALLTTSSYTHGGAVSYATGCSRVYITAGTTAVAASIPSNAKYLWICTYTTSDRTPESVKFYYDILCEGDFSIVNNCLVGGETDALSAEQGRVLHNMITGQESSTSTDYTNRSCSLGGSKRWFNKNGCTHIVIPCEEGDVFDLVITASESTGAFYGWLASYSSPSTNATTPYVSGYDRDWLAYNVLYRKVAPSGAHYLCLSTKDGDGHADTWSIVKYPKNRLETILPSAKGYTDDKVAQLRSFAGFSCAEYNDVWETVNSSWITATKSDGNLIISMTGSGSYPRAGFSIDKVKVRETILITFDCSVGVNLGYGETLSSTWKDIGTSKHSLIFTKTSLSQKYIFISVNSYSVGTVLTLENYKVYRMRNLNEVLLKSNNGFTPSSYIPIKESYENYMSINASSSQGCTIYGNYFIQGFAYYTKKITIYNLSSKTKIQDVDLPTFGNSRYHSNTISFSGTKYSEDDDFPLLYMCSGYTDTTSATTSEVYVVRIIGSAGSYTTSLIQTITIDFGLANGWTEFVVDPIKNRAWITGTSVATIICIDLPSISESAVTINSSTPIVDSFSYWVSNQLYIGTSKKSSGQGMFFYHNRIYLVHGVPTYEDEGEDGLYITVTNTLTHCVEALVPLKSFGLSNGTLTYEPEGCFIWNDNFYIAYHSFIAKIIQN